MTRLLTQCFRDFADRKETTLPALKEIHLNYPSGVNDAYTNRCTGWPTLKAGVVLHLESWPHSESLLWARAVWPNFCSMIIVFPSFIIREQDMHLVLRLFDPLSQARENRKTLSLYTAYLTKHNPRLDSAKETEYIAFTAT